MFEYKVNLGCETIDLDELLDILEDNEHSGGDMLHREMVYQFGEGGRNFIVNAVREKVQSIKDEFNPEVIAQNVHV